jgi:hypothetical protein
MRVTAAAANRQLQPFRLRDTRAARPPSPVASTATAEKRAATNVARHERLNEG